LRAWCIPKRPNRCPRSDPQLSEEVNEWYVGFGKWQTKVLRSPDWARWPSEERDGLDAWILKHVLPRPPRVGRKRTRRMKNKKKC